ncbi:MAG: DUF1206 domain-containing protein [Mycobacteriales bacterium]
MTDAMTWSARFGLAARGGSYLVLGTVALLVAFGRSSSEADQRGALATLAQNPAGKVLLLVLAVGFAAYALWRFSETVFGVAGAKNGFGPRAKSLGRGLIYGSLALSTLSILSGSGGGGSQADKQQDITARTMANGGGRYLVGAAGVTVLVVGGAMAYGGAKRKFDKHLERSQMSANTRSVVDKLGIVGTVSRGLVVALVGVLVIEAAVTFRPEKARGLDGALRTLAGAPYGRFLLVVAALGLLAFGCFGFAEARWRRTESPAR